jgi:hypothetical protein
MHEWRTGPAVRHDGPDATKVQPAEGSHGEEIQKTPGWQPIDLAARNPVFSRYEIARGRRNC